MSLEDELRGSDEVEHNIHEREKVTETNHVLGKRVEYAERNTPINVEMVRTNNFVPS